MNTVLLILMMVIIGALIGGVTNSLAIKMLFRPYKPIFIGKWRVPFTPGLIPKRRDELAEQMGRMVVNHLLTPEGIGRKLHDGAFKKEIISWVQNQAKKLLQSNQSLEELARQHLKVNDLQSKLQAKVNQFIQQRFELFLKNNGHKSVAEVLPEELLIKGDAIVPTLTEKIIDGGKSYFSSQEGKEQLSEMIDRFLMGRGTLGNMISMFLGNERLVDKVQPEIIKMLNDQATHNLIEKLIAREWENIKAMKVERIVEKVNQDELITTIQTVVHKQLQLENILQKPLHDWTDQYEEMVVDQWIPIGVEAVIQNLSTHLGDMMERLHLAEVVKEQVETFSVDRLEEMVLSISKREFKMITYLGALLGGLIGFVQAMIVLFLQ